MERLRSWLYGAFRGGIQGLWATVVAWPTVGPLLAQLSEEQRTAIGSAIALALSVVVYGFVVGAIRWLETRNGMSPGARLARFVARSIMLGFSKYQPVYATSDPNTVPTQVKLQLAPVPIARSVQTPSVAEVLRE